MKENTSAAINTNNVHQQTILSLRATSDMCFLHANTCQTNASTSSGNRKILMRLLGTNTTLQAMTSSASMAIGIYSQSPLLTCSGFRWISRDIRIAASSQAYTSTCPEATLKKP